MLKLFLLVGLVVATWAHGLHANRAEIALRHTNHLTLTLYYDPVALLTASHRQLNFQALSAQKSDALKAEYRFIKNLLQETIRVRFGADELESGHYRFSKPEAFTDAVQSTFMESILNRQQHSHQKSMYLKMELDGFIPKGANTPLHVHFPKELAEVIVTFYRPVQQSLIPDSNGSDFRLDHY